MRKIEITNKPVLDILNKKNELAIKGQNLLKEMEQLEAQFNKNISELKRIDERSRPKLVKLMPEMGEYEQVSRVMVEKDKWFFEIVDRLDEFKEAFNKSKE